jgi:uncharacterized protein (TIGR02421 family)
MILKKRTKTTDAAMQKLITAVRQRLENNMRIRRALPSGGLIHIDRALPFVCVYRLPPNGNDPGTKRLVRSEASYIVASGGKKQTGGLLELVNNVGEILTGRFGACLILEIWAGKFPKPPEPLSLNELSPRYNIIIPDNGPSSDFLRYFEESLNRIKISSRQAAVELQFRNRCAPPGCVPLLKKGLISNKNRYLLGLEVAPVYRDPNSGELFPLVLRAQNHSLSKALRRVFFNFVRSYSKYPAVHRHALGRRAMVKAVWETDRILSEVSSSFDFLLQVTPVNVEQAWWRFQRRHYEEKPQFHYRPTPFEPIALKRKLFRAPLEKIEDPALSLLFHQKLNELEQQITLLQERNTSRFILESAQIYGKVSESLVTRADELLNLIPPRSRERESSQTISSAEFADLAVKEIEFYRSDYPTLGAEVSVRGDVTGLMVSQGTLLVSQSIKVPVSRAEALLQHEVGTHVLTYHNGKAQPLKQLYSGLAGYDAFQEGIAVLSEYLVGGLSRPRLRLLAGRVMAVNNMLKGADFIDNFRILSMHFGFSKRTAYIISMRVHRGGGLTKDATYLQGLQKILRYLSTGGELDPLFLGKIGAEHVPIIRELLLRGVLKAPPLKPRYLKREDVLSRLEGLRKGFSLLELIKRGR